MRLGKRAVGVAVAGAVGQVIALIVSPILSRLLTPAHFGLAASLLAVSGIASTLATLRIEELIPESSTEKEKIELCQAAATIAILVAVFGASVVLVLPAYTFDSVSRAAVAGFAPLILLHILITGILAILLANALRAGEMRAVGAVYVNRGLAKAAATVTAAYQSLGAASLVLGALVEQLAGVWSLRKFKWWSPANGQRLASPKSALALLRRNERLALLSVTALLRVATNNAMVITFSIAFSVEVGGALALAQRITLAPASMVATAVYQSVLSSAAAWSPADIRDKRSLLRGMAYLLALVAVAAVAVQQIDALVLISVFGAGWGELSTVLGSMVLLSGCYAVSLPSEKLLEQRGYAQQRAWLEAARLAAVILVPLLAVQRESSAQVAIMSTAAVVLGATLTGQMLSFRALRNS